MPDILEANRELKIAVEWAEAKKNAFEGWLKILMEILRSLTTS